MILRDARVLGSVVVLAVLALQGHVQSQAEAVAGAPPPYEELVRLAGEVNKTVPTMVSARTELFQVVALPPSTFVYNYRLITVTAEPWFVKEFPNLIQQGESMTVNQVCSNPDVWIGLLSRGVTMRFAYHDKDRVFIGSLDVTKGDCDAVRSRIEPR